MMQEIGKVKFNHGVVPEDHVNLNISVIADASKTLAGTVIHARFLKKELVFSCFHVQKSFQMDSYNLEQNYLLPPWTHILLKWSERSCEVIIKRV